jgi:hypothetical protein
MACGQVHMPCPAASRRAAAAKPSCVAVGRLEQPGAVQVGGGPVLPGPFGLRSQVIPVRLLPAEVALRQLDQPGQEHGALVAQGGLLASIGHASLLAP